MKRLECRFDPELQMFVDHPREANPAHLGFLRWLYEHGRFEQDVDGPADPGSTEMLSGWRGTLSGWWSPRP